MHKRTLAKIFILIISTLFLCSCASKEPAPQPSIIKAFEMTGKEPGAGINNIRRTALINASTALGAQAGLAWRSQQINHDLLRSQRRLDQVFNFRALMLKNDVLPPVLAEGQNSLNLDSNTTLRLADRVYKIVSPPRLITAPPTWRDYLWMGYKKPEKPNSTLLPENDAERTVWNEYITKGWKEGIQQADQIFSVNLGRLKRDYNGMILYRILLDQKMVSAPFVAKAELGVTGDANEMRINDQVLRITATSELQTNSGEWRPALTQTSRLSKVVLEPPRYFK